jgi:hypothetical protein
MLKSVREQALLIKKAQELLHNDKCTHAQKGGTVTEIAVTLTC